MRALSSIPNPKPQVTYGTLARGNTESIGYLYFQENPTLTLSHLSPSLNLSLNLTLTLTLTLTNKGTGFVPRITIQTELVILLANQT